MSYWVCEWVRKYLCVEFRIQSSDCRVKSCVERRRLNGVDLFVTNSEVIKFRSRHCALRLWDGRVGVRKLVPFVCYVKQHHDQIKICWTLLHRVLVWWRFVLIRRRVPIRWMVPTWRDGLIRWKTLYGKVCLCDENAYTIEGGYMVYVCIQWTLCVYGYSRLYLYFESAWVFLDKFRKVLRVPWTYLSFSRSDRIQGRS